MANGNCIIEARDETHDWDSDYVSSETWTLGEAREYIRLAESGQSPDDQDWTGWEFRICMDHGDGAYVPFED